MAAAVILTADLICSPLLYGSDDAPLTVEEISQFLQSKQSVSAGERGYQYICDWVAANSKRAQAAGTGGCSSPLFLRTEGEDTLPSFGQELLS